MADYRVKLLAELLAERLRMRKEAGITHHRSDEELRRSVETAMSLSEVSKHGNHSESSWRDADRIREEMKAAGRTLPKLKSVE